MVGSAAKLQSSKRASSAMGYCALVALAILQLGVALHHDEHSATELTSSCVACVQLEQDDDVLAPGAVGIVITPDSSNTVSLAPQRTLSGLPRYYQGRAPPNLS